MAQFPRHRSHVVIQDSYVHVQLELPATNVPSEFSQPHSPVLGSLIQSVPTPLDVPSSLNIITGQCFFYTNLMENVSSGKSHLQKKVQQSESASISDEVGAVQV